MTRPTLHVVALPHTQTLRELTVCAFTAKIVKFGKMMTDAGWRVILYSGEHNDTPCAEHVAIFSDIEQKRWYGDVSWNDLPSKQDWNSNSPAWQIMNMRAVNAIKKRAEPRDIVCLIGGWAQKFIADQLPGMICCEWGVGYEGIFSKYCCFESRAWMHFLYGKLGYKDGRFYDAVIPNFFDPEEFPWPPHDHMKPFEDYLLYFGRVTVRKGVGLAADIARRAKLPLVVCGSGVESHEPGKRIVGRELTIEGDVHYVGTAGWEKRNALMAGARALLVPTQYIEPFGGVAVEAQLSGCPAITTDWGAFPETVTDGFGGYRFRTMDEAVEAVRKTGLINGVRRKAIRDAVMSVFSLEAVAPLYTEWFMRLHDLWEGGFYGRQIPPAILKRAEELCGRPKKTLTPPDSQAVPPPADAQPELQESP